MIVNQPIKHFYFSKGNILKESKDFTEILKKKILNYNEQIQVTFTQLQLQKKMISILDMKEDNYFNIDFKFKQELVMNDLFYPNG